ncbi:MULTISPECIES: helix-turn-helix domain-containing protein [Streptomyces]|uniref:helix-turn-helix domain-containing protein n=1 Tax=Streptomyces TaxID=1883 RepID=UPI001982AD41|nr:hypothetical protein GCM10010499_35840 [Streptomyces thermoviolaceus subsp. apingens]GHB03075.1 hypothetical protein GCM10010512_38100 [Streptomyces thermoviolaceus subsp. thermoviolaceus]
MRRYYAIVRLLRLLDRPSGRKILAPLVKKEILGLLLRGVQGAMIRQLGPADSTLAHISRAAQWIREHHADSSRAPCGQLPRRGSRPASRHERLHLSPRLRDRDRSPIQFQKHVRLQEARLLLAGRPSDNTGAGHAEGYHSPSQFSCEYRRMFRVAPSQDSTRLRALRTASALAFPDAERDMSADWGMASVPG